MAAVTEGVRPVPFQVVKPSTFRAVLAAKSRLATIEMRRPSGVMSLQSAADIAAAVQIQ